MIRLLRVGRQINLAVVCGFTGALIYVRNNNFEKCKEMLRERKNDPQLLLPPPLKKLADEVMNEMKLTDEVKSKVKMFLSETSDFQSHGSVNYESGALLGVPQYFVIDQNVNMKLTLAEKGKFTDVKDSNSLDDSLYLSNEAKKFAIARELYELLYSFNNVLYVLPLGLSVKFIFLSYFLEKMAIRQHTKIQFLPHTLLLCLATLTYAVVYDLTTMYAESNADFMATDLGKSYLNGGIEYYSKMIKKNVALKKINKNAPYSTDGDVNYSVFGKHHMPLQMRMKYLKDLTQRQENKPSIWQYVLLAH